MHDRFTPRRSTVSGLLLALAIATADAAPPPAAQRAVVELLNRAASAVDGGELERADAALERALRIDATDAAIWRLLAEVRRLQGQTAQSDALLAKARALDRQPSAVAAAPTDKLVTGEAVVENAATTPRGPARATGTAVVPISNMELARRLRLQHARLRLSRALAAAR